MASFVRAATRRESKELRPARLDVPEREPSLRVSRDWTRSRARMFTETEADARGDSVNEAEDA